MSAPILTSIAPITFDAQRSSIALNFYGLDLTERIVHASNLTMIVLWEDFEYTLKMKNVFSRTENNLVCEEYELDIL